MLNYPIFACIINTILDMRFLLTMVALFVCAPSFSMWYETRFETDGIYYATRYDGTVGVINPYENSSDSPYTGNIVIPEKVVYNGSDYVVSTICSNAFNGSSITSVSLPNTILSIEGSAFCNVDATICIPESVTNIEPYAFNGCTVDCFIPNTGSISDCAFYQCHFPSTENLARHSYAPVRIPSGITSIGQEAFAYTGVTYFYIPESVESIGNDAFVDDNDSKRYFYNASNVDMSVNSYDFSRIGLNPERDVVITAVQKGDFLFVDNLLVAYLGTDREVSLPHANDDESYIVDDDAFMCNPYLTSVTIPSDCSLQYSRAFNYCSSLSEIIVNSDDLVVAGYTFANSKWYADQPCGEVYLGNVFLNYKTSYPDEVIHLSIKSGTVRIAYSAMFSNAYLVSLNLPNSIRHIDGYSFHACSNLSSVTTEGQPGFPSDLLSIEDGAFLACCALSEVSIPSCTDYIAPSAFASCAGLQSINVCQSNSKYRSVDGVLYSSDLKTLVTYPAGKVCSTVIVPSTVQSICSYAFSGINHAGRVDVYLPAGIESFSADVFNQAWADRCDGFYEPLEPAYMHIQNSIPPVMYTENALVNYNRWAGNMTLVVPPSLVDVYYDTYVAAYYDKSISWTAFSNVVPEENEWPATPTSLMSLTSDVSAPVAPAYNIYGAVVPDNQRGFIIKDGKKYIRR